MRYVAKAHQGTLLVQGKRSYTFTLEDGRKVKGADLVKVDNWSWQQSLHAPGCRYVRLRARSRTYGQVLLVMVDKPGEKPFYLISSPVVFWPRRGDLISPGLVVAWQTNSQRYLEPAARVGGARAHIRSRLA